MSFREIRNFTEILKTLGYRRLISLESFRQPNFHLVADILVWLVKRFDADYNISTDYSTSEHRVLLIRSVTEFMALKTGLKLNMKKLYLADGHAVKEMLKIASLLYDALKMKENVDEGLSSFASLDLSAKIQELKLTRELALQITRKGSSLFDLLSKEPMLRESRISQANNYVDISEVEEMIRKIIDETTKNITQMKQQIENISSSENNLDVKISKKENDLERISKRLETLKGVRPAFLEEYERYEDELNQIYENYVIKFRCYTYLQQQLQQLLSLNQAAVTNSDVNDQDETLDKIPSIVEDGSLSSPSPPPSNILPQKAVDAPPNIKKPVADRIRTAVDSRKFSSRMYSHVKEESEDLDDDDEGDDEFLGDDSFLNNNDSDDDSELQQSDIDKLNDDKSDDTF